MNRVLLTYSLYGTGAFTGSSPAFRKVGTAPSRYEDPDDAERKKRWFQMNDKWAEQKINEVYLQSQC